MRLTRPSFKQWQLPLTLVLFLSGIMLVLALRSLAASDANPSQLQNDNLISLIKTQEQEISGMESDIDARRSQINSIQLNTTSGQKELSAMQEQIKQLQLLAGFTAVQGPGVQVSLDDNRKGAEDAQASDPSDYKPDDYLIHYTHLLYIVNELRVGGAEAISINDQRIVGSTDIRCAGPLILVNTTRLAPPYIIRAIGDQENMSQVLQMTDSEYNILKMAGFPVSLELSPQLQLPAYQSNYQFSYATP